MNCSIAFYGQRHWPEYLHQLTRVCTGTRINVVTETEQEFNERGLSDSSWRHLLLWECADILIALGSLSMQPFWAKDGNRKCAVFPLNLTSHCCIFKSLFTKRRLVWKSGSGHCPDVRNVQFRLPIVAQNPCMLKLPISPLWLITLSSCHQRQAKRIRLLADRTTSNYIPSIKWKS